MTEIVVAMENKIEPVVSDQSFICNHRNKFLTNCRKLWYDNRQKKYAP